MPNPDYYGIHAIGSDGRRVAEADVATWLMTCAERARNGPHVLFLLDLCGAGEAVRFDDAIRRTNARRTWIVAAAQAGTSAFDARFTRSVSRVLERAGGERQPGLDLSSGHPFLPLDTFARQVGGTVTDLAVVEGRAAPQTVTGTSVDIAAQDVLLAPFFPNPRHRAEAPTPRVVGHDRQASHFLSAASGHPMAEAGKGLFTGRARELSTLLGWLADGPQTLVVTGRAGVGKSALVGMLVCTAHPHLSTVAPEMARPPAAPLPHGRMAAVTVRELDVTAVVVALGTQLKGARDARTPAALVDAIRRHGERPVLVVDALEEALDPAAVLRNVLLPLTSATEGGAPICRLLVAARSADVVDELSATRLDLDKANTTQLRVDIEDYATGLLRGLPPYETYEYVSARAHLASAIAEALTCGEQGAWGEYLITRMYVQHIANQEPVKDETVARGLGAAVPLNPAGLLDVDLDERPSWVRPVLSAVAWAHGDGMPSEVMPAVAAACAGDPHRRPSDEQVADVLSASGSYLRQLPGSDGFVRYQVFHEGLADRLRDGTDALAVFDALMSTVPRRWDLASPYVRRHALDHAKDAGRVAELLADADFLLSGPAGERLASLEQLGDQAAAQTAVVRAAQAMPVDIDPGQRRVRLAVEALRNGAKDLAGALSDSLRPVWHVDLPATRNAPKPSQDAPMVVVTEGGPTVEIYRLGETPTLAYSYHHVSSIRCVAMVRHSGETEILCGGNDHSIAVWPLRRLSVPRLILKGHRGPVRCMTSTMIDGKPIAVTGAEDRTVRLWDLQTGELIDTITTFREAILDITVLWPRKRPPVVVVMSENTIHVRDLLTPRKIRDDVRTSPNSVVLFPREDGSAVAVDTRRDGLTALKVIDLISDRPEWTYSGLLRTSTALSDRVFGTQPDFSLHKETLSIEEIMGNGRFTDTVIASCAGYLARQPAVVVATGDGMIWLNAKGGGVPLTSCSLPVKARGLAVIDNTYPKHRRLPPTTIAPSASIAAGPGYDGAVLAVSDSHGMLRIRHPLAETCYHIQGHQIRDVHVHSRDGGAVVCAYSTRGIIAVVHPLTGRLVNLPTPARPSRQDNQDWVLTEDRAIAVRINHDGSVGTSDYHWNIHTGLFLCVAAWRLGDRALAAACASDSTLRILDLETGALLRQFWLPAPANAVRASGNTILVDMHTEAIAFELTEEEL
nr:WD40 repeat domain-containing protein [Kibdelosporangium sp. MJ126-NF4]